MSDFAKRREDSLAALKARRAGGSAAPAQAPPPNQPTLNFVPSSPDPHVLVPSSSPAAPPRPNTSKFFSNFLPKSSMGSTNGSLGAPGAIPSSRLGRSSLSTGSPASVLSAISRRVPDDSPQHQPSRLKARYTDETSPTKAHSPTSSPDPLGLRTPSLVQIAKEHKDQEDEMLVARLNTQFGSSVKEYAIREIVRRNKGNPDRAINEVSWMANRAITSSSRALGSPNANTTSSLVHSSVSSPVPAKVAKAQKNEKSRIYANRAKGSGKRRDPDEDTESEAELEDSDGGSENSWSGDEGRSRKKRRKSDEDEEDEVDAEGAALKAFNTADVAVLTGTIACSEEQAEKIISLRPYEDTDDVHAKLTKARGVSYKLFEQYAEIMEGFVQIDACLNRCEAIAKDVGNTLSIWRGASAASDSVVGTPRSDGLNDVKVDVNKVSELLKNETDARKRKILGRYIQQQPESLKEGTTLKDYQLLGVNWLNLLYSKKIGCILADEMGLGKTIQVIAFLAHLKERGIKGPHMIYVPASTLENWIREFEKFAPGIDVQTYYGSQKERAALRDDLKHRFRSGQLEVVLASYTQVTSHDDLSFFRKKIQFETCIYDEGHRLKSCTTKAYTDLMSIQPKWRLLLTGTPLQNNLQELVSLLMFIHKDTFTDAEPYLRAVFKSQGHASLLSQQRTSRARTMLTPFVLRRRKAHVLTLPPKIETVEHCDMTAVQAKLYRETMGRSKKLFEDLDDDTLDQAADEVEEDGKPAPKGKAKKAVAETKPAGSNSSHILMDLRKAASHPLLFRRHYTDAKIRQLARECLNTPQWCDSNFEYVVEDLQIMSDAEISHFCAESDYDELRKFALEPQKYLEGGKVAALAQIIERSKAQGKRILLFSQFVMILDILEKALAHLDVRYTRLDGQTRTDERQALVDEFTEDEDITVFLLSTKAGGVGINLTAASVVVIYDQDFNPHNDRQAADRAYRIGQEREVEVIKLITKDSIDEDMLAIGTTKLQLDDAVGGEEITLDGEGGAGGSADDKTAKEVRKSLLTTLRNKFEAAPGKEKEKMEDIIEIIDDEEEEAKATPMKKKARGATQASQA